MITYEERIRELDKIDIERALEELDRLAARALKCPYVHEHVKKLAGEAVREIEFVRSKLRDL